MSAAFAEAYLFKQLRIPFGTGSPADFHGQRDSVVFSGHIRCNAVMSVGNTVACMCPLLRAGADGVSIIGVEIDELSAGLQHAVPLTVGFFRIRKRSRQIAGDNRIEALVEEVRFLSIHHFKSDRKLLRFRLPLRLADHLGRQVDTGKLVAFF